MDQKFLYEQQANYTTALIEETYSAFPQALDYRNKFVVDLVLDFQKKCSLTKVNLAELSTGEGVLSLDLVRNIRDAVFSFVDISPSRLQILQSKLEELSCMESEIMLKQLNFDTQFHELGDNSFDVVIALDIMEHVFDVFGFLRNCHRILKDGGILILRVPNIAYIKHRFGLMLGRLPITASWFGPKGELSAWRNGHGWDGGHLHYFTIPTLYQLLNESGFQVKSCEDPGTKFSGFRRLSPALLYSNPLLVCQRK
jgi:2-polyprenyl-3-methyl-5-hydroxy-6-metoxy-1,4-benzoquinol methylase